MNNFDLRGSKVQKDRPANLHNMFSCPKGEDCPASNAGCNFLAWQDCVVAATADPAIRADFAGRCHFLYLGYNANDLININCAGCRVCVTGVCPTIICIVCGRLFIGGAWTEQRFEGFRQMIVPYVLQCKVCRSEAQRLLTLEAEG